MWLQVVMVLIFNFHGDTARYFDANSTEAAAWTTMYANELLDT